jgi:DNA-directed RNA polymerase specialized sigma24 family protein
MPETAPQQRSQNDIRLAIEGLTERDLIKLRGVAGALIYIGDINWVIDDLLQEAVRRLLDGQRSWRSDMTLIPMLVGIMKSVASAEHLSTQHQTEILESDLSLEQTGVQDDSYLASLKDDPSVLAEEIENQKVVDDLIESVNDDPLAKDILIGNILGYTRAELIEKLSLTPTSFDTANRRLKRQVERFAEKLGEKL